MPGPGGGPSRKSHTKSRKGCRTCKRRHIRCDESSPQCRKCTKHNVRCDYMDAPIDAGEVGPAPTVVPEIPDLQWTPQIEQEIQTWRETGVYPFPNLEVQEKPSPALYSDTDLRLIHHISSVASQMQSAEPNKYSIWVQRVPMFLRIATKNEFVMQALLSLSASHLSWVTTCAATLHLSYHHRGLALKGLQEAIGNFSRANSDAILAASILLSWQASDWRGWASLMQGTTTVIQAMQAWKQESDFAEFIEEKEFFAKVPETRFVDPEQDRRLLNYVFTSLRKLEPYVAGKEEETWGLNDLMSFVRNLLDGLPANSAEEQFELLYPLRAWLFFLPISFVKRVRRDPDVMILLAHFYAVALAVEPLFPAVGTAYFGSMSVGPILEIHKNLLLRARSHIPTTPEEHRWPLTLMEFPLEMVREFRLRIGWRTSEEVNMIEGGAGGGSDLDAETLARGLSQSPTSPSSHGDAATTSGPSNTHLQAPSPVGLDDASFANLSTPNSSSKNGSGTDEMQIDPLSASKFYESTLWRG